MCVVCLNSRLTGCRSSVRKTVVCVVVVTSLLVTVLLAYRGSDARLPPLLVGILPGSRRPPTGSRSRDRSRSAAALIAVAVDGNFTERVERFNLQLQRLRHQMLLLTPRRDRFCTTSERTDAMKGGTGTTPLRVVRGVEDHYIDRLGHDPDIVTLVLPWLRSRSNWSSLNDFSNVLYQRYYEWTADDVLCTWIETPQVNRLRYDVVHGRRCNRNINATTRAQSLRPVVLNAKPVNPDHYWPDDGNSSYPEHFFTSTPRYVFHVHVHRYAIVTAVGDVITANTKLVLDVGIQDLTPTLPLGGKLSKIPCYKEVYAISQVYGHAIFHRMADIVPRLVLCLKFLKDHPRIRILAQERRGRLAELLGIIGLDSSRLVTGIARARIVYQPRGIGWLFANVQESQLLSQLFRHYIKRTFPPQPRNRLILIRRSRARRFAEQKGIEEAMKRAARDYNLTYTLFIDDPVPSLNDTMMMFHSAVIIVAPHGAGLTNMFFSQPGTYVVEGVCNPPHVFLCFQRLAHILGHHWHGVASRGGCTSVSDVSTASLVDAVRSYLRLWKLERSV